MYNYYPNNQQNYDNIIFTA